MTRKAKKKDIYVVDFGIEACLLLVVIKYGSFKRIGLDFPLKFLRGVLKGPLAVLKNGRQKELFGAGKSRSSEWWKKFCMLLYTRKFVEPQEPSKIDDRNNLYAILFRDNVIVLSDAGEEFLKSKATELLIRVPKFGSYSCLLPKENDKTVETDAVKSCTGAKENLQDEPPKEKIRTMSYASVVSAPSEVKKATENGLTKIAETSCQPFQKSQQSSSSVFSDVSLSAAETDSNGIIAKNTIFESKHSYNSGTSSQNVKSLSSLSTASFVPTSDADEIRNSNIEEGQQSERRYRSLFIIPDNAAADEYELANDSPMERMLSLVEVFRCFGGDPSSYTLNILFQQSFEAIAWCKQISVDEVGDQLAKSARYGFPLHLSSLGINETMKNWALSVITDCPEDSRNVDCLEEHFFIGQISRNQLKVVLAIFKYENVALDEDELTGQTSLQFSVCQNVISSPVSAVCSNGQKAQQAIGSIRSTKSSPSVQSKPKRKRIRCRRRMAPKLS